MYGLKVIVKWANKVLGLFSFYHIKTKNAYGSDAIWCAAVF